MYRRLISCLLCLCMVAGMGIPGNSYADNVLPAITEEAPQALQVIPAISVTESIPTALSSVADINWEVQGNTLHIYGNGDMPDYASFGSAPWVEQKEAITALVVENGITSVGSYAFSGLTKLETVSLPAGLTRLGRFSFQTCSALWDIVLPDSLRSMGMAVFSNCVALEKLRIPEGVTTLPSYFFYNCAALTDVKLPQSLTTIEEGAFSECVALQTLSLPTELTTLGEDVFVSSGIVSITVPDKVTSLYKTFRYCHALEEVTLPSQLTTLQEVFQTCDVLTQITFPASVTYIDDFTVQDCPNLKRIIFLGDLPQIEALAFDDITAECYVPEGNETWIDTAALKNYGGYLTYLTADANNICDSHAFGDWVTIKPNQCVFYGIKGKHCQTCSAQELGGIPSAGHFYTRWTTPAGAETVGYYTDICSDCGYRVVTMFDDGNLTYSDAILFMQDAIARRQTKITVRYWDTVPGSNSEAKALLNAALVHTGVPTYGDYLLGHLMAYSYMGQVHHSQGDQYLNTATFNISYRTTARQEEELNCWLTEIYDDLNLDGKSDFEKVQAIHDFVVYRLRYDTSLSRYSAYHALADGYAVCQGYALLIYRLMLMAGLDCRYISGDGGGPHGWNIVKVDGIYYYLDATWDDPIGGYENYNYFLKGSANFLKDHTPDAQYDTPEFHAAYPCSETDYCADLGKCGTDARWVLYSDGTLVIYGSGTAKFTIDWTANKIKKIRVEDGITALDGSLFFGMSNLERIDFMGDMPQFDNLSVPHPVVAYYPATNPTWQNAQLDTDGGRITWRGYLDRGSCGANIQWEFFDDGTLIFTGTGPMQMNDYLAPWLYEYQNQIKNVIIGEGITTIGDSAFLECSELVSVSIPSTVTCIEGYAFMNCKKLASLTLPEGLETIGDVAFYSCEALTAVSFPKSLKELGQYAFEFCSGLREITFKGKAPDIRTYSFNCVNADVYYPANNDTWTEVAGRGYGGILNWIGVETIRVGTLSDCIAYVGEDIVFQLEATGEDLHYQWYLATTGGFSPVGTDSPVLTMDATDSVTSGDVYCVVSNDAGDSVTSNYASFNVYYKLLENTTLELSLDYNESHSLLFTPAEDCYYTFTATEAGAVSAALYEYGGSYLSVAQFTADGFTLTYRLTKGVLYRLSVQTSSIDARDLSFFVTVTRSHGEITQQVLEPATCSKTGLMEYTCGLCAQVWTQPIPVEHNYVDGVCSFCQKVQPTAQGQLTDTAYWELTNGHLQLYGTGRLPDFQEFYMVPWYQYQDVIHSVTVQEGITYLGNNTFVYCSILTDVSLPVSLVEIGESVFQYCYALEEVDLPENLQVLPGWTFYQCKKLKQITVPASVTAIGAYAFYDCLALETAVLPDGITDIGKEAFANCENLKLDKLPARLETIGEYSFSNCYALTELTFPASVTSIGKHAFSWCDGIKTLRFTGSAPTMYSDTFYFVKALAYYPQTDPTWTDTVRSPHIHLQWQGYTPGPLMGDVDGSGTVDGMDATLLLQFVAGWNVPIAEAVADVDGNGIVDGNDATLLLQYAAGWNVTLGK